MGGEKRFFNGDLVFVCGTFSFSVQLFFGVVLFSSIFLYRYLCVQCENSIVIV